MDDGDFQGHMPASFGGSGSGFDVETQIEGARRADFAMKNTAKTKLTASDDSDFDNDTDSDEDEDDDYPISHEVVFKTHDRAVTSITVDPSGARMVTGSTDCTLKLHDFASMAPNTIRAFKSVDPTAQKGSANTETHPIHVVKFNPSSGSHMLAVSATPQAKILSRDGDVVSEFAKGDMYLRDMNMTKGHVSEITTGTWHPSNYDLCVTAGTDSTLRIWDLSTNRQKDVIVHKSKQPGSAGRSRVTAVAWGSEIESQNSLLVAAALDGSLSMWDGEGPFHRPSAEIKDAHKPDTWTSGIDISADGRLVATRGGDDTVKIWDTRKFKAPLNTANHPSTSAHYPTSNIVFSPTGTSLLTGSSEGSLYILNAATLKPETVTPITPSSPLITVLWHPKLNQVITGSANASTHILFSPKTSAPNRGALAILSKPPKRRHIDDDTSLTTDSNTLGIAGDTVGSHQNSRTGTPSTIGLTASGRSRDPRRPHLPNTTPFAKSAPGEEHIKKNIPLSTMREEDPREALLKYADKAEKDPMFTRAWAKTQPKTIYDAGSDGEEDGEGPYKKKVKR